MPTPLDDITGRVKGVERAQREPEGRFTRWRHVIDVPALERAYRRQRGRRSGRRGWGHEGSHTGGNWKQISRGCTHG